MAITAASETIGLASLEAKLKRLDRSLQRGALEGALMTGALPIQNGAKENIIAKLNTTGLATGNLSRSILVKEDEDNTPDRVFVWIGTDVKYAAIHEFGGTIVPKKGKFLTIPLTKVARGVGAREYPGKLRAVVNGEKGVLRDESGVAQYALVKRVTIPARPYLRPAFDEHKGEAMDDFIGALNDIIRQAVGHAG